MKPEQAEIARLKREVIKLKAERDILKNIRGLLREGIDMKFFFIAKYRVIWPAGWLCGGARCLAGWLLCLADTAAQPAQPERRIAGAW